MDIAIVNESGDSRVTKEGLEKIAAALTKQVGEHLAGWWEVRPIQIGVYDSLAEIPAGWAPFRLVKTLEDPNALAYHSIDAEGRPTLFCGTDVIFNNGGTLLEGSNSISAAMSHEVIECIVDPYVDTWTDMPDGKREVAYEAADPVEGDFYEIDGVAMSNFVGARWFSDGPGPYDYMGRVSAPFTMSSGGYMVVRTGGPAGRSTEIFGDEMPEWKRAVKSASSRRIRRQREKHGL